MGFTRLAATDMTNLHSLMMTFRMILVGKTIEMPRVWTHFSYVLSPASAICVGGVVSMEESLLY